MEIQWDKKIKCISIGNIKEHVIRNSHSLVQKWRHTLVFASYAQEQNGVDEMTSKKITTGERSILS